MKKQTKIAVGVSAAALLAVGASMTSFAAKGWVNEDGNWYYYNQSGDRVANEWKSYNGQYFYLGEDEAMVTNQLIEDNNGNYYYVDANGVMVKNAWIPVPADDDEQYDVDYRWYYFGSTGKAYKSSTGKSIGGKKYGFDDDGKMLFGYVNDNKEIINDDSTDPVLESTYYFGTNDDGARHQGWLKYEDALSGDNYTKDYYWFYYGTNGKKVVSTTKTISGKKYSFNSDGVMNSGFATATASSESTLTWWGALADGSLAKNQWIWAIPSENLNEADYLADEYRWFRTDAAGNLIKSRTKKINSKWYAFDQFGRMKTGLVWLSTSDVANATLTADDAKSADSTTAADIYALASDPTDDAEAGRLHYFSNSSSDGSMKTGTVKIELADDTYTFGFNKTSGAAKHGKVEKKIYNTGILQSAGEDRYAVVKNPVDGKDYVVGSTGTITTGHSKFKTADDEYLVAKDGIFQNPGKKFYDSKEADDFIKDQKAGDVKIIK